RASRCSKYPGVGQHLAMVDGKPGAHTGIAQPYKGIHTLRKSVRATVTKTDVVAVLTPGVIGKLRPSMAEQIEKLFQPLFILYRLLRHSVQVVTGQWRLATGETQEFGRQVELPGLVTTERAQVTSRESNTGIGFEQRHFLFRFRTQGWLLVRTAITPIERFHQHKKV